MVQPTSDKSQTTQRVKVGMIGLAAVILLIGLASALFSLVTRERPVEVIGAPNAAVVANLAVDNGLAPDSVNEPLAELGVAPGATQAGDNSTDRR